MTYRAPLDLLREIAALLDELSLPWCLGGSLASALYGEPRATRDIDLIVVLNNADAARLANRLVPRFYVSSDAMREAIASSRSFNIVDPDSGFKIDVFVRGSTPFDREEFARRTMLEVDSESGLRIPVKTPEDSILRKLLWYRDGGAVSEQQWRDVVGLLAANAGGLDLAYIDRWARILDLEELLARASREALR